MSMSSQFVANRFSTILNSDKRCADKKWKAILSEKFKK